jgi:hypothetical protein
MRRIRFIRGAARDENLLSAWPIKLQFEVGIRDTILTKGMLLICRIGPLFFEEQWNARSRCSAAGGGCAGSLSSASPTSCTLWGGLLGKQRGDRTQKNRNYQSGQKHSWTDHKDLQFDIDVPGKYKCKRQVR